ncbi:MULTISPECIES: BppU family phage baseplate upper protein [Bacillus]|uniref:BppU family phage baseplate upper protein n=1 Tax=Bacillus TaxID=1386 RepID=UPI000D3268A1|nr:BppU family phage baseplate upper protein [Bacillus mycoides]WJE62833.1 BppU family phage baseplate upper protein [Bacillus mycoides]
MREEEIIVDLDDPVFTKTIRSRQNDKNGLKLIVYLKQKGRSVDLTGYAIKYEATNHTGAFIRDDAQLIDAKNGVFSYTFTSQAVSTSADWTAYFVMEKNAERTSTPDIRIVLKRDVKEGNIKIENYISDFEKAIEQVAGYRKEIDDTNKKITDTNNKFVELTTLINEKGVQVPKITTESGGQTISVSDTTKNILDEIAAKGAGMNTIYCATGVQNTIPSSKPWRGISYFNQNNIGFVIAKDSVGGFYTNYLNGNNGWTGWTNHVTREDFVGWDFTVQGFKRSTDIDWIQMSITNASNVEGRQVTRAKRSGDQVSVIGSLKNIKEGQVVFNVPAGLRPAQQITDVVIIAGPPYSICEFNVETGGNVKIYNITTDKTIHFSINYLV